ncbi:Na/Pi cotransporter family protein [Pseudomonas oligotrophica]|uniref:Na/Pi cotransporter family protein n=1 Tax=Pseudomonas oligotrophica TaxID=2912055 RepID=UPI001EFF9277|nr:Na/Pi symporter [Pseudomonas oligotrophica]MCF7200950.1 Na/Pi symporter [Pseudomonas oligotrophica]
MGELKKHLKVVLIALGLALLALSFWNSAGWLELCAGLALFLFGMQCLEEGLRQLAGSRLEQLLGRATATPLKALLFGISGTMLLQSSTLVSLLTIAFISTGLIQLAGGIAILFGANLGSTSGIWLLAVLGHNVGLGPLALPLLVTGVLLGFSGERGKAAGRLLLGIAFIFLGVEQIKGGFASFGGAADFSAYQAEGLLGQLGFVAIGLLVTVVLQSSHASLMLTLAALGAGQLTLGPALAIAIGANVGTSVTTAFVGSLGGNRSGQRLALAHVLFNGVTAVVALALLLPLTGLVRWLSEPLGLGDNALIQLALFHSLFNALGVALFWFWQAGLARLLERLLPERAEPAVLITELAQPAAAQPLTRARYLNERALDSADAAASAVAQELQHLTRLSLEVICHAMYLPVDLLQRPGQADTATLGAPPPPQALDAEQLYQRHIKGVYGDLLAFMGRLEMPLDEQHQSFWLSSQVAALQLVDAVKDSKHLQKNLGHYLRGGDSAVRQAYIELRRHLLEALQEVRALSRSELPEERWNARLQWLDEHAANFDAAFRRRLFEAVRSQALDGLQMSSLMNDLGYASRIIQSLRNALMLGDAQELTRQLRGVEGDDGPIIVQG